MATLPSLHITVASRFVNKMVGEEEHAKMMAEINDNVIELICHRCGEVYDRVDIRFQVTMDVTAVSHDDEPPPEHIFECKQFPNAEGYLRTHYADFYYALSAR
jgi:hypothetical protein